MNEAETTVEELRELIRTGHGMIGDINRGMKQIRALMVEAHKLIEESRNAPRMDTVKVIREATEEATKSIAEEVAEIANQATALVQDAIFERFNVLMDTLVGYDAGRRSESIPDMLRNRLEPKLDLSAFDHIADPIERPTP